jgi:hypothetical protein
MIEEELRQWYRTPSYVAKFYNKPPVYIYRAMEDGRLKFVKIPSKFAGRGRDAYLLDIRELPAKWPKAVWKGKRRGR